MEPLALNADKAGLIRPVNALQADLGAVLREGRVLAGEVLESFGGGSLLIAVGRHKVAAQSQLQLEPGQRFLFRVEVGADGVLLRLLQGALAPEDALLGALRGVVGQDLPVGELLENLAASLRARLVGPPEAHGPGEPHGANGAGGASPGETALARLRALLDGLDAHVLKPGASGAELLGLLGRAGLSYEAALLRAAQRGGASETSALAADLKAELLAALSELPEGEARRAVAAALAGLEAEQLLNLARHEAGQALHWSLPLQDGAHWATAHLLVRRHREHDGEPGGEHGGDGDGEPRTGAERDVFRVVVGVDLSRTGPVRVDLWMRETTLGVRFLVERPALAERLQAAFAPLVDRLEAAGFGATLTAGVGAREELDVEAEARDVEYLRRNRLMDVTG